VGAADASSPTNTVFALAVNSTSRCFFFLAAMRKKPSLPMDCTIWLLHAARFSVTADLCAWLVVSLELVGSCSFRALTFKSHYKGSCSISGGFGIYAVIPSLLTMDGLAWEGLARGAVDTSGTGKGWFVLGNVIGISPWNYPITGGFFNALPKRGVVPTGYEA